MRALHSKGQWFDPLRRHLEKVVNVTKVMDSHKNHKAFVQMTEQLERMFMSACSAPSPCSNPFATNVKDILSGSTKNTVTEL